MLLERDPKQRVYAQWPTDNVPADHEPIDNGPTDNGSTDNGPIDNGPQSSPIECYAFAFRILACMLLRPL
jgi:hypothetical protein